MKSTNTKTAEYNSNRLIEDVSEIYDCEMKSAKRLCFEAFILNNNDYKDLCDKNYLDFVKISNSIQLSKFKLCAKARLETEKFLKSKGLKQTKLVFNFNAMFFKGINKLLCNLLLGCNRHNSK